VDHCVELGALPPRQSLERWGYYLRWLTHNPCPHPTDLRTKWVTAGILLFALGVAAVHWVLTRDDAPD